MAEPTIVALPQLPPNETIYIRNLNEKASLTALKRDLLALFVKYGCKEVIAHKNIRMRGQAFVLFETTAEAEKALKDLQGYPVQEKAMLLQFAKSKSDRTIQKESPAAYEAHKAERLAKKAAKGPLQASTGKKSKRQGGLRTTATDGNPPHNVLFVQNLPDDITTDVMQAIFGRFAGFRDIRLVPGRNISFVEYADTDAAVLARDSTSGITLSGQQLKVTFGKK